MTGPARETIGTDLARRLVDAQFPQWAHLPIRPVAVQGWDNRTFRLGDDLKLRLPTGPAYALQVAKEVQWLPLLAPMLPLPIPVPVATGSPGGGYPWPWMVQHWLEGEDAGQAAVSDGEAFAADLAAFLSALQAIDARDGPPPGCHNFHRGGDLAIYANETGQALSALAGQIDTAAAARVWEAALSSRWDGAPVWVHGDVSAGNLLVRGGRLSAVIDFGSAAVGDPACDLSIAWTHLQGRAREVFRAALPLDAATWARGRGWTLWKALISLAASVDGHEPTAATWRAVIDAVVAEHLRAWRCSALLPNHPIA